jgi:hypothetical protein
VERHRGHDRRPDRGRLPLADNHVPARLLALAIRCASGCRTARPPWRSSSRWPIGLAFAFAVLWKTMLSPDFLDGRFFASRCSPTRASVTPRS